MQTKITIAIDAMGGDNAPESCVGGVLAAAKSFLSEFPGRQIKYILCGRSEAILSSLQGFGASVLPENVEIFGADEVIDMHDEPSDAIRTKKNASMVAAFSLLRDGTADAFVSAGSTGAVLAGATLLVRRVRGIRRAAISPLIPTKGGGVCVLIDAGATVVCTPEYLLQYAYMGRFYLEGAYGIKNPRIGLLNNGAEDTKGGELQLATYKLLTEAKNAGALNFIGNVEARDPILGLCDVVVSDGFTGNILLKAYEGASAFVLSEIKNIFTTGLLGRISAGLVYKRLAATRKKVSPEAIGGTILLGISKPVIKAHGNSSAAAITASLRQAIHAVDADVAGKLKDNIDKMKSDTSGGEE
ncbi:MAG: phosphate acyltransferase PlsX [Oscillospiraceae bacterium]|jgi:glycerol-3-phosphate acyltransferase PlsX|nr:phosphate acyltransferase PlsX [Oscillospiraceae bacterium]